MATWVYLASPAGADEGDTLTFARQHNVIYRNARNSDGNRIANVGNLRAGDNILLAFRHPNRDRIVEICALIVAVENPAEGTNVIDPAVGMLADHLAEAGYSVASDNAPGVIRLEHLRDCHIKLQGAYGGNNAIHQVDQADAESVTEWADSCEDGQL